MAIIRRLSTYGAAVFKWYETVALRLPLTTHPYAQIDVKNFRAARPGYKISWNIWIDYHGIRVSSPKHKDLVPITPQRLLQDAANLHSPERLCARHLFVLSGHSKRFWGSQIDHICYIDRRTAAR